MSGAASLSLEFVRRPGSGVRPLETVEIPAATAQALSAAGGDSMRLDWAEVSGSHVEPLASVPMTPVASLKGVL